MAVIVARPDLNFWERLYLPSIVGGMLITLRHMLQTLWRMVFPRRHVWGFPWLFSLKVALRFPNPLILRSKTR
ncbi:MAG: hypothetical protein EBT68_03350 [Verrucomicrobia bacterium]|nr:hypothetical protein [Verrucomicrobiota bacterium]